MRLSRNPTLFLLTALCPLAYADVQFTVPAAGASVAGGTAFTVTWTDSGDSPSISDLTAFQLLLYTGSNSSPVQLTSVTTSTFDASGDSISVTIPVTVGGETTNAYFFGMISTASAGGTVTNYSDRFTLTGMTGTFTDAVTTALATVSGTTGPDTVNDVTDAASATTGTADDGVYGTSYQLQTGLTRYAPMQPIPGTKITATNTAPLFPTSSVALASTYLASGTILTTLTQTNTHSVSSHANTAATASQPTDDMAKFLNRWKD